MLVDQAALFCALRHYVVHAGSVVRYRCWRLSTLLMNDYQSRHSSSRLSPCSPSRLLHVLFSYHQLDSRPYSVDVASSCSLFVSFIVANFRRLERSQISFGIRWCLLSGLQVLFSVRYMRLSHRSMATCRQIWTCLSRILARVANLSLITPMLYAASTIW